MLDRNIWNVDIFLILRELTNPKMENWSQISEEINQAYSVTEKVSTLVIYPNKREICKLVITLLHPPDNQDEYAK